MAKVALIPPYSCLNDIRTRKLQMLLPECLKQHERRYSRQLFASDAYIILDNGLFEDGQPIYIGELFKLAAEYQVDEVVLPDIRNDRSGTVEAVTYALQAHEKVCRGCSLTFMVVVQGYDQEERFDVIRELADVVPPSTVLGFPRRLTQENVRYRLELMERTISTYGTRFPLHMLGLSREWPAEFVRAVRQFGSHLRSLDTSAPYTYALDGAIIQPVWTPEGERPKHFFVQPASRVNTSLVTYNTYVIDSWARGITPYTYLGWKETQVTA